MSMPVPVHPDDRLVACQFCKLVFLARPDVAKASSAGTEAVTEHEKNCAVKWFQQPVHGETNPMQPTGNTTTAPASVSLTIDDLIHLG